MRSIILGILLVSFVCVSVHAATTNIEGYVKDKETGEALLGANVILVKTSLGAATDNNGKYTIRNVPPGTYTLRATYLGYNSKEVTIDVKEGKTIEQNFELEAVGVVGQTVVVTGQASGQNSAINQQLSADQIVSVVSASRIQELPDANAAESLGRLPGISVLRSGGEANEVVIRGLAPKFNQILINGVQLTSSNPDNTSVDLSMISSNMLEGMEVKKTVTPDMDASVIGGVVNLELREAKVSETGAPKFGLLVQGGYNALSNAYNKLNNYKYVGSAEDRFLDNKLGVFAQLDVERKNLTSNQLGAAYSNDGDLIPLYFTEGLNLNNIPRDRQRYDGAVVLDYKLNNGTLKLSNFLSTGTTDIRNRGEYFGIQGTAGSNVINTTLAYERSTLSVITNALHLQYQLPIFQVNTILAHTYTETKDPGDWTATFIQGSAGLGSLSGKTNLDPTIIPQIAAPDANNSFLHDVANSGSFSGARALSASLDLTANANISNVITSVIKFGGMYRYQLRSYDYHTTGTQGLGIESAKYADTLIGMYSLGTTKYGTQIPMSLFLDPDYNFGKFLDGDYNMTNPLNYGMLSGLSNFLQQNIGLIAQHDRLAYFTDQANSTMNDYKGHENQSAAYIMATINIGPEITIIPGVRYQNLQTVYTASRGLQNTNSDLGGTYNHYDTTVTDNHGFWLPDVSLKYKPFTWADVRFSYTNTLAYPDFTAITPIINVSSSEADIEYNNYQLVPSRSANYDLYLSIYNNEIGLFTVGGFLKHIDNLIYPTTFYVTGAEALKYFPPSLITGAPQPSGHPQIHTFINDPNRATAYGLEFDWQTHFWYLPYPLEGLVLNVNYTHVFSKERYPIGELKKVTPRLSVPIDTFYTTRLLYQPNNIANISIGYDYEGFSVRISMIYQDDIFTGPDFYPQLRTTTSAYTRWDISAKQDLPWFGLQVYGDLSNINGENDIQVIQAPTGVPQNRQDYGTTADLGLRVNF
jgi:TonB-dependent receptor